jgi:hypothetical protein
MTRPPPVTAVVATLRAHAGTWLSTYRIAKLVKLRRGDVYAATKRAQYLGLVDGRPGPRGAWLYRWPPQAAAWPPPVPPDRSKVAPTGWTSHGHPVASVVEPPAPTRCGITGDECIARPPGRRRRVPPRGMP